jgi:hypothetical protein
LLENHSRLQPQSPQRLAPDVRNIRVVDADTPGRRPLQEVDCAQKGAFSGSARAYYPEYLAPPYLQRNVPYRGNPLKIDVYVF